MYIQCKIPQNSFYLILLSISHFFNGGVSMFFHFIFRRNFKLQHLYYAYILSFIWKSLTYFIYRFQEIRNKKNKKKELTEKAYKKSLFSSNKNTIFITAIIDFSIKFCLIQLLNNRPNIDSPLLKFDIKFFYILIIIILSPKINGYNFYISHKISLFILMILSIFQLISFYYFSRESSIHSFILKKITLLFLCEFLLAIQDMLESKMLKKNKVNPFLILSMQGLTEIFLSILTLIVMYIINGIEGLSNRRFNRLFFDIVRFIMTFSVMTSYDIFKILVNNKITCYHWILSEKFIGVIFSILFSFHRFHRFEIYMILRSVFIFFIAIIFSDIIIINFNEENSKLNFEERNKENKLIEENEGTEMAV